VDHLRQAEQLEVVDQERAEEHQDPAEQTNASERHGERRLADIPDDRRHWAPQPEQADEDEARQQHVGAALDGGWHELRPPALEGLPGHDAVLQGEHGQQHEIDDECFDRRSRQAVIDVLGHGEAGREADGVGSCRRR
jgi:hypothetical protein